MDIKIDTDINMNIDGIFLLKPTPVKLNSYGYITSLSLKCVWLKSKNDK